MKKDKIIFWISTALTAFMMLFSAFNYFTNPGMKAGFPHLGFPDYFRIELGTAKVLAAIALLLPIAPALLKELAYAGLAITFVSATIAHAASGDPAAMVVSPLIFLAVLATSYIYYREITKLQVQRVA